MAAFLPSRPAPAVGPLLGQTANALAPDALADLGGGACFNDARVQVALLPVA